ncbi:MAG: UDP-N-acetylglucosamine 2-epimerase (non-hydrolyzing) [Verrucomicrobiota bacterium]
MSKIVLLAGARPNYMKVFPLWRAIRDTMPDARPVVVHTGQHYDALMSDVFFTDFGMPKPDRFLGVGSGPHGLQTGKTMIALEPILQEEKPDLLVVVGDVNSTMAGALVGVKMGIPVAHVEAGLRSFDRTMPEEINRMVTDAVSDILLTSCRDANENLRREGIPEEKIHFVGNIMIDSLVALMPVASKSAILERLGLSPRKFVAVTLHRPSNVDDPATLRQILDALDELASSMPVVFPVHPRTRKVMGELAFTPRHAGFKILDPLGYLDFLRLESESALVITDSGGIQEETTYLGISCLTVRPNTERPITITRGTNRLVAPDRRAIVENARAALGRERRRPEIELWDGATAPRILAVLSSRLGTAHERGVV